MKRDNSVQKGIKKPAPFIAPYSNTPVSKAELERRKRKNRRLRNIGINPTKIVDEEGEAENPYRVQAMIYISRDEEVPKELLEKIKEYDVELKKRLQNKSNT